MISLFIVLQHQKLILEFDVSNTFLICIIIKRILTLNHEFSNHMMKDDVIVVFIFKVLDEILNDSERRFKKETKMNVFQNHMQNDDDVNFNKFDFNLRTSD